jgi:formylglycine-generating enzyme required for sulfatase activity
VKEAVLAATGGAQQPWQSNRLGRRIYLTGSPKAAERASQAQVRLSEAAEAWAATKDTTNVGALELFMGRFQGTYYADLARLRVEELKRQHTAPATPPTKQAPALQQPAQPAAIITPERSTASLTPGHTFRDCPNCPEMVVIPAGEFMMGFNDGPTDEKAVHKVRIAKSFAVGKYAVTSAEWDACVANGGCAHKPTDAWGRDRRSVIYVSWDDAPNNTCRSCHARRARPTGYSARRNGNMRHAQDRPRSTRALCVV